MNIIQWLSDIGTNDWIGGFFLNNIIILSTFFSIVFAILKYIAKKTPDPEDDRLYAEIENAIRSKLGGILKRK